MARNALALDRDQPEALAALALLPPMHGDWLSVERRLLAVHRDHPDQTAVLAGLGLLTASVGRMSDAAEYNRRATELDPLSPIFQYRRTYQLWATGHPEEADGTIDRALQLWPTQPAVWVARLLLFAGTGRTQAAISQLGKPEARTILPPPIFAAWKTTLDATEAPAPASRAGAIDASMTLARLSGSGCVLATLLLCQVGALDEAFTVSEGFLLRRGPLITDIGRLGGTIVETQRWRKTMQLFIPPTANMRADARFEPLMADIGLADYWRASGTVPSYRLTK